MQRRACCCIKLFASQSNLLTFRACPSFSLFFRYFFQNQREKKKKKKKKKVLELFSNAFNPPVSRPINFRPSLSFSESKETRERERERKRDESISRHRRRKGAMTSRGHTQVSSATCIVARVHSLSNAFSCTRYGSTRQLSRQPMFIPPASAEYIFLRRRIDGQHERANRSNLLCFSYWILVRNIGPVSNSFRLFFRLTDPPSTADKPDGTKNSIFTLPEFFPPRIIILVRGVNLGSNSDSSSVLYSFLFTR